jgi:hypothetical protein
VQTFFTKHNDRSKSFISTLTRRGDAFGRELTKSRRFGSSGLSLAFKGLVLGRAFASKPRLPQSATVSRDLKRMAFLHQRVFCRWPTAPGAPERRSGWEHRAKAIEATWVKVASWGRHGSHQLKIAASALTLSTFHWSVVKLCLNVIDQVTPDRALYWRGRWLGAIKALE